MIFFNNGEPAYITKRFDVKEDKTKLGKEDFATLAGKTSENAGPGFKYNYSYEELANLVRKYIPAYKVESERLFELILFNYLFSNGDAHLKNFSVLETPNGDHTLSPAYDLINTGIHVNDSDFALDDRLFADFYESNEVKTNGREGLQDFQEFARRLGIKNSRRDKLLEPFLTNQEMVEILIKRSFLNEDTKKIYFDNYITRRNQLNKF